MRNELQKLGVPEAIGPIQVADDMGRPFDYIDRGLHMTVGQQPTSTGRLISLDGNYVVKTFLDKTHPFLQFSLPWQRWFSLTAEYQKAGQVQAGWPDEDKIHLGIVGVTGWGDGAIELTDGHTGGDSVEPGLLMRYLPEDNNLANILLDSPEKFLNLVPAAVEAIVSSQVPLSQEDGLRYGGAQGIYEWINGGNLGALRNHDDARLRTFAKQFWGGFSGFIGKYGKYLDQRAEIGAVVWDGGDDKPMNMFAVGEGRVGIIDPITLLIKAGDNGEYILAPWPFRDRISQLAYFTVYLKAAEKLFDDDQRGLAFVQQSFKVAVENYETHFGESVSEGMNQAILALHMAALASVELEVNRRLASGMPDGEKKIELLRWATALKIVALESVGEAHQQAARSV